VLSFTATSDNLMTEHLKEYRRSEGNMTVQECPSLTEKGRAAGTILGPENRTSMMAGCGLGSLVASKVQTLGGECCKTEQQHVYQSNTNNDDDLDMTEAPTADEYVTAAG
jgi:hypothetical protein